MFFLRLQAAQAVHLLEDQLKKANEEVDGEKALQQVMESTLQKKTQDVT